MNTPHLGRKILRLRELRNMKQEALAMAMGVSQQTISNLEKSEEIDDAKLWQVAAALDVSVEAIKNFSEEDVINYINNFSDNSVNQGPIGNYNQCNFSPLDKVVELYERLLEAEKEKIAYLEKVLSENKGKSES
jgi:transcriptional regulator with XRE-family HTH domain